MFTRTLMVGALAVLLLCGCSSEPQRAQLSGKVTFKGQPVPAAWISFMPEGGAGTDGQVKLLQITDGVYNTSQENEPGLAPGQYRIRIAGFDGNKVPNWGQGKQIFNPVDDTYTVPEGSSTKDFVIPDSAGENVKIVPTADS